MTTIIVISLLIALALLFALIIREIDRHWYQHHSAEALFQQRLARALEIEDNPALNHRCGKTDRRSPRRDASSDRRMSFG